ncbi:MAG TPA: UbiA family prenyltransferase [Nitrososphaera sp.]|nr:UbiA family prenyltransferase [Nitrososphaera sp.]
MQDHVGSHLRQYLLLIRLPNVFTTPSNILAGYFATTPLGEANGLHLIPLVVSSGLLYIAGITMNDYFDIETDREERPSRPLPSGRVPRNHAMAIALIAIIAANAIVLVAIGPVALAVSLALTATIIAYDYRLKHATDAIASPFTMGGTRFLNVILGASPAISATLFGGSELRAETAIFAATSLLAYVTAIMLLSKKEVGGEKPGSLPFYMTFVLVGVIAVTGLLLFDLQSEFLVILAIFAAAISLTFIQYISRGDTSRPVQKAIRNMIISIIILDSVFVSGTAGLFYGLAALLLIIPAVVGAKKLYMT